VLVLFLLLIAYGYPRAVLYYRHRIIDTEPAFIHRVDLGDSSMSISGQFPRSRKLSTTRGASGPASRCPGYPRGRRRNALGRGDRRGQNAPRHKTPFAPAVLSGAFIGPGAMFNAAVLAGSPPRAGQRKAAVMAAVIGDV
jgi:hypothetical protein